MLLLRRIQTTIALLLVLVGSTAFAVEEGDKVPAFDFASIYADKPNINLEGLEGKTLFIDFGRHGALLVFCLFRYTMRCITSTKIKAWK